MFRSIKNNIPVLDLHGCDQEQSTYILEIFLNQKIMSKFAEVEIIHGKGSGKLKKEIDNYLTNSELVKDFYNMGKYSNNWGSTRVQLIQI